VGVRLDRPPGGRLAHAEDVATPSPVDVVHIEDVTTEHLGGASRYELAAFKLAAWEYQQAAHVPAWTALAVIWDGGNWREMVAERQWLQWTLAQRRTAEEGEYPTAGSE
jgi:hypothetical protein